MNADVLTTRVADGIAVITLGSPTTSTATPRNDTDTSTEHFLTRSWTASSTRSRAGSPPSISVLSRLRRVSLTKSRCHPQTVSSTPSTPLRPR